MNKNILIVFGGGFLIALFVALMVQSTLKKSKKKNVEVKIIEILVAAKDLDVGHIIGESDLKWQKWPEKNTFIGAIIRDADQSPLDIVSGKLLRSLSEGQPLHMTVFAEEDKGSFLSANIKEGMRAVGISVSKHIVADRLVRPGDFVDVIVTYRVRVNTRSNPEAQSLVNRYASETVIENVRILTIDANDKAAVDEAETGKKKKKKSTKRRTTVTLEVLPEQAEKLVLADKMGSIGFAVRSLGDVEQVKDDKQTTDVRMSGVMTTLNELNRTGRGVRVYNGSRVDTVETRVNSKKTNDVTFNLEDSPQEDLDDQISKQDVLNAIPLLRGLSSEE